ncbi:MAG: hypothetical protein M3P23_16345 [Actinomycetota bacterium]|nr:hypothetical protein [Actinomycetota bacterium]
MTALAQPVLIGGRQLRLSRLWLWLSSTAALLAAAGNIAGLLAGGRIYGKETVALADASAAQDIVNLLVVVPLMVALAVLASRGSLRAHLSWLGCAALTTRQLPRLWLSQLRRLGPLRHRCAPSEATRLRCHTAAVAVRRPRQ